MLYDNNQFDFIDYMNTMPIIALIGIAILVTSTIGFGAVFTTAPDINRISGSDDNIVGAARANITAIEWIEEVSVKGVIEMDSIVFAVGNEDEVSAQTFQICAVVEGPTGTWTPAAGQPPACRTTPSIPAWGNNTLNYINFTTPMNVTSIVDISFTIEELDTHVP